ncbi:hypothetical protein [Pontibacillus halophilus]|uniref:hypothetical protein n=1 Tax=Pontibacillus halophilus TaxID=516704 RepID=UPI00041BB7C9|nr:hypothetical protein [Pontibacillus halophilus]
MIEISIVELLKHFMLAYSLFHEYYMGLSIELEERRAYLKSIKANTEIQQQNGEEQQEENHVADFSRFNTDGSFKLPVEYRSQTETKHYHRDVSEIEGTDTEDLLKEVEAYVSNLPYETGDFEEAEAPTAQQEIDRLQTKIDTLSDLEVAGSGEHLEEIVVTLHKKLQLQGEETKVKDLEAQFPLYFTKETKESSQASSPEIFLDYEDDLNEYLSSLDDVIATENHEEFGNTMEPQFMVENTDAAGLEIEGLESAPGHVAKYEFSAFEIPQEFEEYASHLVSDRHYGNQTWYGVTLQKQGHYVLFSDGTDDTWIHAGQKKDLIGVNELVIVDVERYLEDTYLNSCTLIKKSTSNQTYLEHNTSRCS